MPKLGLFLAVCLHWRIRQSEICNEIKQVRRHDIENVQNTSLNILGLFTGIFLQLLNIFLKYKRSSTILLLDSCTINRTIAVSVRLLYRKVLGA